MMPMDSSHSTMESNVTVALAAQHVSSPVGNTGSWGSAPAEQSRHSSGWLLVSLNQHSAALIPAHISFSGDPLLPQLVHMEAFWLLIVTHNCLL